jgi:hypothetical protein
LPLIAQLKDPIFKNISQSMRHGRHVERTGVTMEVININTTFTKEGIRREEWIFEDWESAAVVKHRYLYFEEGTLIGGWFQGSGERLPIQSPSDPHSPKPPR